MFVFNFITVVDKCYDGFDSLFIIMAGQCHCQYYLAINIKRVFVSLCCKPHLAGCERCFCLFHSVLC